MSHNFEAIQKKLIPIFQENNVTRSSVFGSYASGTEKTESDVDILVEFESGNEPDLLAFLALKRSLETHIGKSVDLVTLEALSPFLRAEILKQARPFYAKN